MIIKYEDKENQVVEGMRGGVGHALIKRFDDESKMIAQITLPPNASIGLHQHLNDEEIIYIIEGHGVCISGGNELAIAKGFVNYVKRGESHSIINNTEQDLVLLAIILK